MSNLTHTPSQDLPGAAVGGEQLGQAIRTGARWTIAARFCGRIVRVLAFFILAKLLGPTPLGAVGLIYVIDAIGMIVTRLGFSAAIIQKKDAGPEHFDSAMFINLCAGAALAVVIAVFAPVIGRFFDNALLGRVLLPYSIVFVARSLSYAPAAVLRRRMQFRTFALMGEFANVAGCLVMIALAFAGLGVWSVLYAELLRAILLSGLSLGLAGHRFRPWLHRNAVREMVSFSGWATVNAACYYGLCNIDYIVVGRVLGSTALGWYVLAFRLISQPLEQIATRLHEVMFPAFSRFQDKPEEVLRVYRKLVCTISLVALPLLSIAVVLAQEFFDVVMGPEWRPAIVPFQILCVAGMMRAFIGSSSALLKSRGYVRFEGLALAVLFALMWAGVWVAASLGVNDGRLTAVAVAVDVVVAAYLGTYLIYQHLKTGVRISVFINAVMPGLHCTIIAVATCIGLTWLLVSIANVDGPARLLISSAAGTVVFLLAVVHHPDRILRSVVWELKNMLRRSPKADA